MNPRCWRAPRWAPLWLRRAFPGCWTQDEIDRINHRAEQQYQRMQQFIETEEKS
jgi:hypothetical protein